jgi:hypothetical protein
MRPVSWAGTVLAFNNQRTEASLLSLPIRMPLRAPLGVAAAVAVAVVASAPAQAAPTAVERTALSFNYTLPAAETSFNHTLPGDELEFHFVRKAG